jgi:hypothetical protein
MILHTIETAAPIGALVIATIAALRARLPRLDGWAVLVVAGLLSLGLSASSSLPWVDPMGFTELAVCVWLVAIGVPAAAAKVASHAATQRTVVIDSLPRKE